MWHERRGRKAAALWIVPRPSVPPDFPCRLAYAWQLGRIGPDFGSRLILLQHHCQRCRKSPRRNVSHCKQRILPRADGRTLGDQKPWTFSRLQRDQSSWAAFAVKIQSPKSQCARRCIAWVTGSACIAKTCPGGQILYCHGIGKSFSSKVAFGMGICAGSHRNRSPTRLIGRQKYVRTASGTHGT